MFRIGERTRLASWRWRPRHRELCLAREVCTPVVSSTGLFGGAPKRAREARALPNPARCVMTPTLQLLLTVSAALFSIGLLAALSRRHAIFILIGIELMLAAAN